MNKMRGEQTFATSEANLSDSPQRGIGKADEVVAASDPFEELMGCKAGSKCT